MRIVEWLKSRWWAIGLVILGVIVLGNIIYQVAYPLNALPPGTKVDGMALGGVDRQKAVAKLNDAYGNVRTDLYFGDSSVPFKTPKAKEVGIQVDNTSRLSTVSYPLFLRFVPSSILWASSLNKIGQPTYNYDKTILNSYALKNLGEDCTILPQNASLKLDDTQFKVVPMIPGGKCNMTEFKDAMSKATVDKNTSITVRTPMKTVDAKLTDAIAQQLADKLNTRLKDDMPFRAGNEVIKTPSMTVKGWLTFNAVIPEDKGDGKTPPPSLAFAVDKDRLRKYLDTSAAAKLEKKPGVTKVSTTDFRETSRTNGASGEMIEMNKTTASIYNYIADSKTAEAVVTIGPVAPTTQYTRTYTPTADGYRALIQQFPQDNPGTYAIVLQENSAKKPLLGGDVNADSPMPAAGIEGIYLAYVAQMGIQDGSIQPTDTISGSLNVNDCVTRVLQDQDKDCIVALTAKLTNPVVQSRLAGLGLSRTSFSGETNTTTARDLMTFTNALTTNKSGLKNKDRIISPLRSVNQRDGILAAESTVLFTAAGANDGVYNEIGVINNKGQYAVTVMSQGSDAKTTAKLIQAITKLHLQKEALKS